MLWNLWYLVFSCPLYGSWVCPVVLSGCGCIKYVLVLCPHINAFFKFPTGLCVLVFFFFLTDDSNNMNGKTGGFSSKTIDGG